jgi:hypothetical protein
VAEGKLDKGSKPSSMNNFQARYAIRHRWQGAVACENPRFGVWGGPPAGQAGSTAPRAATKVALAPRGGVELASFVREDVPSLSLKTAAPVSPPSVREGHAEPQAPWLGTGALLGLMGIGAVTGLLVSQRSRRVRRV